MRAAPVEDVILPADLLEEILHRLPSNDLLKFKIVCKDWLRLISSPEFIQKHLQRSKAESQESRIVASKDSPEIEILDYRTNNLTSKKIRGMGHVYLLGSCDGLVLYYDPSSSKIGALNPCTGKIEVYARLPKKSTKYFLICTWFGRHPATGEYVLVIVKSRGYNCIVFNVYDLSRNSLLSTLTEETVSFYDFSSMYTETFLLGRLHVTALNFDVVPLDADIISCVTRKTDIFAYDLQANKLLTMRAPLKYCGALGVVDGCLCALDRSEVWIMKEYGVNESWIKYANIDDKILISLQICPSGDVNLCHDFLKVFRDGAAELLYGNGCFIRRRVVACIDSLVSPAVVWGKRNRRRVRRVVACIDSLEEELLHA